MVSEAFQHTAAFLCSCGDWAGQHEPVGKGACDICGCEAFTAASVADIANAARLAGIGPQTRLADIVVKLPKPATFRVEFSRPVSANRGSAKLSGVEAFAVLGPFVLFVVDGEIEAMIPVDRVAYVQGIDDGE